MIRRRFIQYSDPGVINNIQKGYEREVRVLSYDNNYFILAIGIRNIAIEQEHQLCNLIILDIDIPYRKDPDNVGRNVAYCWMEYITNKLRVTLLEGHTVVEVKEDCYGVIIRIKTIQGRGLIGIGISPGYQRIQQIIHHVNIPLRPGAPINQEVKLQDEQSRRHAILLRHMTQQLPSMAEFDRQLLRMHVTRDYDVSHTLNSHNNATQDQQQSDVAEQQHYTK